MNWIGEKKFSEGTSATSYSISFSGGNVNISNGGYVLKYNSAGGLRSYSSTSNLQPIQLFKRSAPPAPAVMHTITFLNNDGNSYTQEVEEFVPTALIPNTFTLEGYEFDGWQDINGTFYADCATFGSRDAIACGLGFFGREHMLFASDMPFDPEDARRPPSNSQPRPTKAICSTTGP